MLKRGRPKNNDPVSCRSVAPDIDPGNWCKACRNSQRCRKVKKDLKKLVALQQQETDSSSRPVSTPSSSADSPSSPRQRQPKRACAEKKEVAVVDPEAARAEAGIRVPATGISRKCDSGTHT